MFLLNLHAPDTQKDREGGSLGPVLATCSSARIFEAKRYEGDVLINGASFCDAFLPLGFQILGKFALDAPL